MGATEMNKEQFQRSIAGNRPVLVEFWALLPPAGTRL